MLEFAKVEVSVELDVLQQAEHISDITGMSIDDMLSAALSVILSSPRESTLKRIMRKVRDWQIDRLVVMYRDQKLPTVKSPKPKSPAEVDGVHDANKDKGK